MTEGYTMEGCRNIVALASKLYYLQMAYKPTQSLDLCFYGII